MSRFVEENGGISDIGLIQMAAEVSPHATPTRAAAATMTPEENYKARISDLECQLNDKEEEIKKITVEMSEEIRRLKSELVAMGILLNAKEEQARRSNRRSKLRVYLP